MKIVVRADASLDIGSGHVMRCLTLAAELRRRGVICHFICRDHPGNLIARIQEHGHRVSVLPLDPDDSFRGDLPHSGWLCADWREDARQTVAAVGDDRPAWLLVDHYALDARWERIVKECCGRVMVIDDLADRAHECDLLLDQTLGRSEVDYDDLVLPTSLVLLGPGYALLRPEFSALREHSLQRRREPRLRRILVTMGGVDRSNATGRALQPLGDCELPTDTQVTILMGEHAPWIEQVREVASRLPYQCDVRVNEPKMAELMAECDLAIGAAGGTALERCCLGLPSLVVVLAENQRAGAESLQRVGAAQVFGDVDSMASLMADAVKLHADPMVLSRKSAAAAKVTAGRGCGRVADAMVGGRRVFEECTVRSMDRRDLAMILSWRNHPDVRGSMYTRHEISMQEHRAWFDRCTNDCSRHLLIVEEARSPLGFVQFHEIDWLVADWGFYAAPGVAKGSGTKLGLAALTYAFDELGFHKVCGQALCFNEKSIALHRKLGFRDEGELRDQHFDGEKYTSVKLFGMLRHQMRADMGAGNAGQ